MMVQNVGICKQKDSFTISSILKFSLIVIGDDNCVIVTNSIGDITAADIETGLIVWQLPTRSSNISKRNF